MKLNAAFLRILSWAALAILPARADPPSAEADRVAWFREARYGLFIHWGIYSVPAGVYHGRPVMRPERVGSAQGEWIMHVEKIPVAEYAGYARQFNPVKFDADAWVRLAQEAGMKYIVITAKHHDGFAMFKSAASGFNIFDASPFRRDPLRELAAACAKYGVRLGLYYSQAQDWHHPGGAVYRGKGALFGGSPGEGHWDKAQEGDFDEYLDTIALPQVRELLTGYGPISILWWDTPVGMTPIRAARLADALKLQPRIVTNNRLLDPVHENPFSGDTRTPENQIPATGAGDRLFEVCMTMNETWGYKSTDHNWKPAADITRKLIDIASKGGNFLLNVGPTAEGEIPAPSVERLRQSGAWLRTNGEAIYGTSASLFRRLLWGRSTTRGSTLYLHVFDWPGTGRLGVPGLSSLPTRISLLATRQELTGRIVEGDLVLNLPAKAPDAVASVIKLEFDAPPRVAQILPHPDAAGRVDLPAAMAAILNAYGANARVIGGGDEAYIGDWDRENTVLNWEFEVSQPGRYRVEARAALRSPLRVACSIGTNSVTTRLFPTGSLDTYRTLDLGQVDIGAAGRHSMDVKSVGRDWSELRLRGVALVPVQAIAPARP